MLARLLAYVGTLALLALAVAHQWNQLTSVEANDPPPKPGWSAALRSRPAFAVSQIDLQDKSEAYEILRHPEGGRKDIIRWTARGAAKGAEKPVAELEIYHPGGEFSPTEPTAPQIAARMTPEAPPELEAAGIVDSKFGTVALLRPVSVTADSPACLGFVKRFDGPLLQISGWSCQGDTVAASRAAIGCLLSRLVLLTAGNDPRLAELFARAELKRGNCAASSADWVTSAENPRLRGTL